jgi:hypothetical protein
MLHQLPRTNGAKRKRRCRCAPGAAVASAFTGCPVDSLEWFLPARYDGRYVRGRGALGACENGIKLSQRVRREWVRAWAAIVKGHDTDRPHIPLPEPLPRSRPEAEGTVPALARVRGALTPLAKSLLVERLLGNVLPRRRTAGQNAAAVTTTPLARVAVDPCPDTCPVPGATAADLPGRTAPDAAWSPRARLRRRGQGARSSTGKGRPDGHGHGSPTGRSHCEEADAR